jgi:hypothetical protein
MNDHDFERSCYHHHKHTRFHKFVQFHVKSNFHRFVQKLHMNSHAMVNMNDICVHVQYFEYSNR